mmetsp:Transcript_25422/g.84084  ORF Transcript_25422/g.84084 Transcript_25422/m.84084 type:complete len:212 (-) Transcript_25422:791-1426(-)
MNLNRRVCRNQRSGRVKTSFCHPAALSSRGGRWRIIQEARRNSMLHTVTRKLSSMSQGRLQISVEKTEVLLGRTVHSRRRKPEMGAMTTRRHFTSTAEELLLSELCHLGNRQWNCWAHWTSPTKMVKRKVLLSRLLLLARRCRTQGQSCSSDSWASSPHSSGMKESRRERKKRTTIGAIRKILCTTPTTLYALCGSLPWRLSVEEGERSVY